MELICRSSSPELAAEALAAGMDAVQCGFADLTNAEGLVQIGLLSRDEFGIFTRAEDFLWAARCHLHYIAKRPVDQLTFDMQVEVAARMGYRDGHGRRAVEHFMQDYFRHATRVGELTRIFLTELEARPVTTIPVACAAPRLTNPAQQAHNHV